MIIGTDVSLEVCRAEGYLMVEFDGRKKFDPEESYRLMRTYPEYTKIEGYILDDFFTFEELKDRYLEMKEKDPTEFPNDCDYDLDNPGFHTMLRLADDIDFTTGL